MATSLIGYNKSASGKNTYIVGCSAINRRQHYCICVNFLRAVEEDRIGESFLDCQQALKNGQCRAYEMRQEEKTADTPIYFVPREEKVTKPESRPEVKKSYRSPSHSKPNRVSKPEQRDELVGADMSIAITEAVKLEAQAKKKPKFIKPRKGEGLMAFAVRFRESCLEGY